MQTELRTFLRVEKLEENNSHTYCLKVIIVTIFLYFLCLFLVCQDLKKNMYFYPSVSFHIIAVPFSQSLFMPTFKGYIIFY